MTAAADADRSASADAALAALVCAIDPFAFGGIALRARAGLMRDRYLEGLRGLLPAGTPWRRLPLGTADSRLFGGLDLAATLAAGRPVAERGILAETDSGILLLPMAERLPVALAARLGAVLDTGAVVLSRDGVTARSPARLGIVALDEGIDDERADPALTERLAFWVDLDGCDPRAAGPDARDLAGVRTRFAATEVDDAVLAALGETALALGVGSLRAAIMAAAAARALAALAGRSTANTDDAAIAARLVLAPRATRLPVERDADAEPAPEPPPARDADPSPGTEGETERGPSPSQPPGDVVLAAAKAAIPPGVLLRLKAGVAVRAARAAAGRAGATQAAAKRGRPAGVRRGHPGGSARLNVIETLRAAAPWQRLRTRHPDAQGGAGRVEIRRDDLRITRFKQRTETTTVFVVDASGSLALNRLAEAKGAVEFLLAECYVRRDHVALFAFRGTGAELLLPPTRSLTRAKRCLAELPGGGPTPLAGAIDQALSLADQIRRRGQTPVVVFLTDGRANVARDGSTGRQRAEEDALQAARAAGAAGISMLVVDVSPRPQAQARTLAGVMGALYLPLPRAEASALSGAVRMAGAGPRSSHGPA